MRILFFDTETTGLPIMEKYNFFDYNNLDKYASARLVSLSYCITDENNNEIKTIDKIIKPTDFVIPEASILIHNITNDKAQQLGIEIKKVLEEFLIDLLTVDLIVAHNISFDKNIILSENVRNKFSFDLQTELVNKPCVCTAQMSKAKFGKYYKLKDLHDLLCKKENNEDYHNSLYDTKICKKCYFIMKNL